MRWMIGGGVLAMTLACGGALEMGGPSAPDGFTCPTGTEAQGGVYPTGTEHWAGWPAMALEPATSGGWEAPDEAWEEIVGGDMAEGDAIWWCAKPDGTLSGNFAQVVREDSHEIRAIGEYKDGQRHGPFKVEWRENGGVSRVLVEGAYEKGDATGAWTWRAEPSSDLDEISSGHYAAGQQDGEWTWTGEGQAAKAAYKEGVLHGDWEQSWDKSTQKGKFKDGARFGTWTVTTDGKVESTEDYGGEAKPKPKPKPRPGTIRRPSNRR